MSAIEVTEKTFFECLYLVLELRNIALFVSCPCAPTTLIHITTISRFLRNFFPWMAPQFFGYTIHQVMIWPSRWYWDSLLETAQEAVTIACTCVHIFRQQMWQKIYYLSVCIGFREWAHLRPESTVPMHPQFRPFTWQIFLEFCEKNFPGWPLNFLGTRFTSNLSESPLGPRKPSKMMNYNIFGNEK